MLINKNIIYKGFTLIELIVVITIVLIISLAIMSPYNYYQNKAKLGLGAKEISQTLYDARNMAINGISTSVGNSSIGLYFDNTDSEKNTIKLYSYPFGSSTGIINSVSTDMTLLKTINLQPGIEVDSIGGQNNGLFFFNAIDGNTEIYTFNGGTKTKISDPKVQIDISYKNSTSPSLQKHLYYYTKTNIVDF